MKKSEKPKEHIHIHRYNGRCQRHKSGMECVVIMHKSELARLTMEILVCNQNKRFDRLFLRL